MCSLRLLFPLILGLLFASCRGTPEAVQPFQDTRLPDQLRPQDVAAVDEYKKKGGKGGFYPAAGTLAAPVTAQNSAFIVDLDAQRVYFFLGSQLIAFSPISSGQKYYCTETGTYTIGQKNLNHRSSSYGDFVSDNGGKMVKDVEAGFDPVPVGGRFEGSLMKWFMRLNYMGSPTAMGFHRGDLPGYPASHGCIRLPGTMAAWFFNNVKSGTPVMVTGKSYGVPYGANQNRPKRSPKVHSSLEKQNVVPQSEMRPETVGGGNTPEVPAPAPAQEPAAPAPTPAPEVAPELPVPPGAEN